MDPNLSIWVQFVSAPWNPQDKGKRKTQTGDAGLRLCKIEWSKLGGLLLPGALLVAVGAELFAPFMLVDLGFASFLQ